jgi:hypothetical protein
MQRLGRRVYSIGDADTDIDVSVRGDGGQDGIVELEGVR